MEKELLGLVNSLILMINLKRSLCDDVTAVMVLNLKWIKFLYINFDNATHLISLITHYIMKSSVVLHPSTVELYKHYKQYFIIINTFPSFCQHLTQILTKASMQIHTETQPIKPLPPVAD